MSETLNQVPEIALRDFTNGDPDSKAKFVAELWRGFQHFGFIVLTDHNVSTHLLRDAYETAATFFALPEDEKMHCYAGADGQRGYTPFGREHAKDSAVPDLKEFWHVGQDVSADSPFASVYKGNVWPQRPPQFKEIFLNLYKELEEAGHIMLEALAPSLEVPSDYFRAMATNGNSILRLLHYPPVPADANPNAIRAAAHEDINLITILVAANGAGLQLLDHNGQWLPIETSPDNLIVDAGDMLARITNGVIPATTHRVVNPSGPNVSRYSMPFFMHPRPDALLSCIASCRGDGAKYPDITANDFLMQRLKEIGLA